ncbi:hypothetical protein CYLTODRAFT_425285 [Cylindrobasidium torrendii FP15055 ss-10]|uniref:Uncharacterized protein n=1 Tax=Cylindrobasidium torrendii FP15055 ss-10 TaxID=1314674 RepID=A0A0D7B2C5_9AGAR|nr:hypothetical protein CYLTODRAFT_425285 [Cylindrobasidium torrendii FP15055 ss-10]
MARRPNPIYPIAGAAAAAIIAPIAAPAILGGIFGITALGPVSGLLFAGIQSSGAVVALSGWATVQSIAMGGALPLAGYLGAGVIGGAAGAAVGAGHGNNGNGNDGGGNGGGGGGNGGGWNGGGGGNGNNGGGNGGGWNGGGGYGGGGGNCGGGGENGCDEYEEKKKTRREDGLDDIRKHTLFEYLGEQEFIDAGVLGPHGEDDVPDNVTILCTECGEYVWSEEKGKRDGCGDLKYGIQYWMFHERHCRAIRTKL